MLLAFDELFTSGKETPEVPFVLEQNVIMDWSHKSRKLAIILEDGTELTGKKAKKFFDTATNCAFYCENIPQKLYAQLESRNNKVYRCTGNDTAQLRISQGDTRPKAEILDIEDCRYIKALFLHTPAKFREFHGDHPIKAIYSTFKQIQKARTGLDNQMSNQVEGSPAWNSMLLTEKVLKQAENTAVKECEIYLKEFPIYTEFMTNIKGLGPKVAAGIIGTTLIHGISNFPTISKYYTFFGIHQDSNGLAARRHKGEHSGYSTKRKTLLMGDCAPSLVRAKSEYKLKIYNPYKEKKLAQRFEPGELYERYNHKYYKQDEIKYKPIAVNHMAERKMVQILMEHIWRVWRLLEGHDARNLYAIDNLGHSKYVKPFYGVPRQLQAQFDRM